MQIHEQIKRVTMEQFYKEDYHGSNQPVIITDMMESWGAKSNWEPEYLKSTVGNIPVPVVVTIKKNETDTSGTQRQLSMKFHEFIDKIVENSNPKVIYYLQQQTIYNELLGDITIPEFIKKGAIINIWIGSGGNITPLHFDGLSNFLAQIKGRKKIVLFPPSQTPNLYPHPYNSSNRNISMLDYTKPDTDKFPKYKNVDKSMECILEGGEVLFLPVFWWHYVETLSKDMTISVNFWWYASIKNRFFTYMGLRRVMGRVSNMVSIKRAKK